MNRQKREQLIRGSSDQSGGSSPHDQSKQPVSQKEQIRGGGSEHPPQKPHEREPGKLPLPE